jgi:endonuclease YncB( thermonuclease family)
MVHPRPKRRSPRSSALALAFALALAAQRTAAQEGCRTTEVGAGLVASVRDGRTLALADGREIRLAGLAPGGNREALRQVAGGKPVRLARLGAGSKPEIDRYGRLVAFVAVDGATQSLQESLLAAGQARVLGRIGDKTCADALLAAEKAARAAKRGLWANPNFAPLSSENLLGLEAARGHFALVEGKVVSVRESGATIYVNFGRRWTRDFTATVLKRQRRAFAAAGIDLKRLEGRRIRVRGFIERRGGPIIAASGPQQIETID